MLVRKIAHAAVRFICDPAYRSLAYIRLFSRRVHQTTTFTMMDRYPAIFGECSALLRDRTAARILSFGCSTGEETLTLRRYLPHADIFGTDVNPHNLKICRRLGDRFDLTFFEPSDDKILNHGPFDAIFCMAVLQRTPHMVEDRGVRNISDIYSFDKFDRQLVTLDQALVVGGYLVMEHCQYRTVDSSIAARYAPLPSPLSDGSIRFDRNGEILPPASYPTIFRKVR